MGPKSKQTQDVDLSTTQGHQSYFSREGFWDKLKSYAKTIGGVGVYTALILYYLLEDERTPIAQRAIIMGALGYLILPLDLIPDMIMGVGFTDDLGALYAALQAVKVHLNEDHFERAKKKYKTWFREAPPMLDL